MKISVFTYADSGCVMDGLSFMLKSTAVYLSVYLDEVCLIVILSVDAATFFGFYSIQFLLSACTWTTANVKFIKRQLHSNSHILITETL